MTHKDQVEKYKLTHEKSGQKRRNEMKANIAYMYGPKDLRIENVEIPELKPNQMLVKTMACGICGSDVHCFLGESAEGRYDLGPYTPGHEGGGQVEAVGSEIKDFKIGDKITAECVIACGTCYNCKEGLMPSACLNFRELGFRPDSPGGFGEYMVMEEHYVHKIPDDWSYAMGAWCETFSIGYFGIWGNGGFVPPEPLILSVLQIVFPISTGTLRPIECPTRPTLQLCPATSKIEASAAFEPEHSAITEGPCPSVAALI